MATKKFDYTKYRSNLTVEKLDLLASFVFSSNTTTAFGTIVCSLKLLIAIAYIVGRKIIIDNELQIYKQQYEQSEISDNRDDIDNLDAGKKNV